MRTTSIHPFIIHFALSLALLTTAIETVPFLKERVSRKGQSLVWVLTLLILLAAVLSGWRTLEQLSGGPAPLPGLVEVHRLFGMAGAGLFIVLWLVREKVFRRLSGRLLILSGALLILVAASIGGHLVYHDHLGTPFWARSTPE